MINIKSINCLPFKIIRTNLIFFLVSFSILAAVSFYNPSPAYPARGKIKRSTKVPGAMLRWPENGSEYAVFVEKSTHRVLVYQRGKLRRPVKVYPCSTGENNGPKTKEKDRKTPEGIYFFTNFHVEKELTPIYGARAFPLDYPNPIDKKEGRRGYGIWFHGTNKPLKPNDTNGCIALENHNIVDLGKYIKLFDTPVIITYKIDMISPKALKRESEKLSEIIEKWRESWEEKEIDPYMSLYSKRFISGKKDWKAWKDNKVRLAKKYKNIEVDVDNLWIIKNDGIVLAHFDQSYRTAAFNSFGKKRLYFHQNSTEWKISDEFFTAKKESSFKVKKRPEFRPEEIKKVVFKWKDAWEREKLNSYISFYDSSFRSRGMNLSAWKKHRNSLNRKYSKITVNIKDLKIRKLSKGKVAVTFKQDYRADRFHDYGLKNILLIKRGNKWKIKKEEWKPLPRKSRT